MAGHHIGGLAPLGADGGARDIQSLLGTRDAHIGESAFLLQFSGVFHRTRMREGALFHAGQEHHRVFEALGGVQGHERHLAGVLRLTGQLVGVGHERSGLQECGQRGVRRVLFEFGCGGLQLGEVLQTGGVLRIHGFLKFGP